MCLIKYPNYAFNQNISYFQTQFLKISKFQKIYIKIPNFGLRFTITSK